MKKKRRINWQKIFSFVSLIFILVCVFWYSGRLIYFYQDSKKIITEEANTLVRAIKTNNHEQEYFKKINQTYYFSGKVENNYVSYSNLLWRIVKVNEDGSILLISENILGSLPYGKENTYKDSNPVKWMNVISEENNQVLENKFNQKDVYLTNSQICIDSIDDVSNASCDEIYGESKLGLLSIQDYINTGGKDSFINNERYTYLSNRNGDGDIWYINDDGKLDTTDGDEFMGIKPIITLSPTLEVKGGTGVLNDPYKIEDTMGMFGSYVKLGDDLWRVYDNNDTVLNLVLQNKIMEKDAFFESTYSKKNYYHNDTNNGSLAYYLNKTYLNSLSYKDEIVENNYSNGFYGNDNDFNYQDILDNKVDTKVIVPSIGDVILNDELGNYFTNTGISKDSSLIYIMKEKGMVNTKSVTTKANIVPCISILKEKIVAGTGTIIDPYRLES